MTSRPGPKDRTFTAASSFLQGSVSCPSALADDEIEKIIHEVLGTKPTLSKIIQFLQLVTYLLSSSSTNRRLSNSDEKAYSLLTHLYQELDPLNRREYMCEDEIEVYIPSVLSEIREFINEMLETSVLEQGSDSVFLSSDALNSSFYSPSLEISNIHLVDSINNPVGANCSGEIEELKHQIKRLKYENQCMEQLLSTEDDQHLRLVAENKELKKKIHMLQEEAKKLEMDISQLEELSCSLRTEKAAYSSLESKLQKCEKEKAQLMKDMREMKKALTKAEEKLEASKQHEKNLASSLKTVQNLWSETCQEREDLHEKLSDANNKMKFLECELEKMTKKADWLLEENHNLQTELTDLQSNLNQRSPMQVKIGLERPSPIDVSCESSSDFLQGGLLTPKKRSKVTMKQRGILLDITNNGIDKSSIVSSPTLASPTNLSRIQPRSLFSELQDAMTNSGNNWPFTGKHSTMSGSFSTPVKDDTDVSQKQKMSPVAEPSPFTQVPMFVSTPVNYFSYTSASSLPNNNIDNDRGEMPTRSQQHFMTPHEKKLKKKISNLEAKVSKIEDENKNLTELLDDNANFLNGIFVDLHSKVQDLESLNTELVKNLDNVKVLEQYLQKEKLITENVGCEKELRNSRRSKSSDKMRDQLTMELKALTSQIAKSQAIVAYLQSKGHLSSSRTQATTPQERQILFRGLAEPDLSKCFSNAVLTHLLSGDTSLTSAVHRIRTRSPTGSPGSGSLYRAYLSYSCPILPSLSSVVNRATQTETDSIASVSDSRNDYLVPSLHQLRGREALRTSHAQQSSKESDESQCYSEPVCLQSSIRRPFLTVPCSAFSSVTHVSEEDTVMSPTIPRNRSFSFVAAIKKGNPRLVDAQSKHTRSKTHSGAVHSKSLGNVYYDSRDTSTLPPLPPPPLPRETALFWSRTRLNAHWRSQNIPSFRADSKESKSESNQASQQNVHCDECRRDDVAIGEDYSFTSSQGEGIHLVSEGNQYSSTDHVPLSRLHSDRSYLYFSQKRRRRSDDMPKSGNVTLQVPQTNTSVSVAPPLSSSSLDVPDAKSSNEQVYSRVSSIDGDSSSPHHQSGGITGDAATSISEGSRHNRGTPSGMSKVVETPEEEDRPCPTTTFTACSSTYQSQTTAPGKHSGTMTADSVEAFPSFTDEFLMRLNLHKNSEQSPESLSEQDVEAKFSTLALAFKTDKFTLSKRLEIHKRQRDIAEKNATDELQALRESLNALSQMCTDHQMRELITKIQHHVDVIHQSTLRVSSRAEVYGAVQEEQRMSNAFEVIVMHAENLKQLREKERGELEEARRLLMDNQFICEEGNIMGSGDGSSDDLKFQRTIRSLSSSSNISKSPHPACVRRASVAVVTRTSFCDGSPPNGLTSSSSHWNGFAIYNGNGWEPRNRVHSASTILGSTSAAHLGVAVNGTPSSRLYIHHNPAMSSASGTSQTCRVRRCSLPVGPVSTNGAMIGGGQGFVRQPLPPLTITPSRSSEPNHDKDNFSSGSGNSSSNNDKTNGDKVENAASTSSQDKESCSIDDSDVADEPPAKQDADPNKSNNDSAKDNSCQQVDKPASEQQDKDEMERSLVILKPAHDGSKGNVFSQVANYIATDVSEDVSEAESNDVLTADAAVSQHFNGCFQSNNSNNGRGKSFTVNDVHKKRQKRWSVVLQHWRALSDYYEWDTSVIIRNVRIAFSAILLMLACMWLFYSIAPNSASSIVPLCAAEQRTSRSLREILKVHLTYPQGPPPQ